LAFRPEGKGYSGGVPNLDEPRGYNFDVDHDYFQQVVWPALAARFPQFERTKEKNTMSGLYDQNEFDATPIVGLWTGKLDNFYLMAGFSGHGLMHAPGCGRAVAELILDGSYQTIDLARFGWARIAEGRRCAEDGIV
jgi:FAD-dependent oxidoreductase domain-containing protein 1